MNILIIYAKPDLYKKPRFGFSYGLLTIATILEKYHTIHIKDFSCETYDEKELIDKVSKDKIDIALIECDSYALKRAQNVIHALKLIDVLNQYVTTIAYGNYCYITKKNFGNASYTITINNHNNIIDCINKIDHCIKMPHIEEFDDLPYINRELLLTIPYYQENNKNTLLQTSKGCENTCVFCQRKGWQCHYVVHSDDYILNEIRLIKSQGFQNIWITDENFTFNLPRAKKLLNKIIQENLQDNLNFFISSWVNVDEEFLQLAKQSNIKIISFGIESGNKEILQFYRKNIKLDHIPKIIQYANQIGIFTVGNFIIGAPMETEQTINETFDLIKRCQFDQVNIKNLDYMIGSKLYDSLDDKLKTEDHLFACSENGLTSFKLEEIKKKKEDFLSEYYKWHFPDLQKKIQTYGKPF